MGIETKHVINGVMAQFAKLCRHDVTAQQVEEFRMTIDAMVDEKRAAAAASARSATLQLLLDSVLVCSRELVPNEVIVEGLCSSLSGGEPIEFGEGKTLRFDGRELVIAELDCGRWIEENLDEDTKREIYFNYR